MKKFITMIIMLAIVLSLSGCRSNDKPSTSIISETELTDREKTFLSMGNDKYFAFDFSVGNNYKWVEIWIDRYEFGKKVSDGSILATGLSMGEKGMILATVRESEKMKSDWTVAIKAGGTLSTGKSTQEYKTEESSLLSSAWGSNNSKNIPINDNEIVLANICYKAQNRDSSMRSLSDKFYTNPDANIQEIADYDLVYLLKCKFYKNEKLSK